MRWTYVLPRVFIVTALWAFLRWGLDPLLRYSAVQSLQAVAGAKADIQNVTTSIYPPALSVQHVAVANAKKPGRNLIEFDELKIRLAGQPFLRRQFVVEEGQVTGVRFHSGREDDGLLEESEVTESEPSWLSEKLESAGEEWLENLTEQAKAQIDPNTLETYRIGQDMYGKWDGRFNEMKDRVNLLKPRVRELKDQFEQAKEGDTLQKIEKYVQLAQKAEQLTIDAKKLKLDVTSIVPEVRTDFNLLNEARVRDQEMVMRKIQLLKPDKRRISETLIGKQMYVQLQELLTWADSFRSYQKELKAQTRPPRSRGTDVEFPILNPSPDFVLAKLRVSGEFSVDGEQIPFEAVITDVTNDAPLLGRPCIVRLRTEGSQPLLLQATYDVRTEIPVISLLAEYSDQDGYPIRAGQSDKAEITGRLSDVAWNLNVQLVGSHLHGTVLLNSRLQNTSFATAEDLRPEFALAANRALAGIQEVKATVMLGGTIEKPEFELESDIGEQLADGIEGAVRLQIEETRTKLMADVNSWATDQISTLTSRFASEYEQLVAEHDQILKQVEGIQTVVASFQSGQADPKAVFRQVRDSKLIPEKQTEQVDRAMKSLNNVNRLIPRPAQPRF